MSKNNPNFQNISPGVYASAALVGMKSQSPDRNFFVESQLGQPNHASQESANSYQAHSRPLTPAGPHANIPFANNRRDAGQYGVSTRVSSPNWDVDTAQIPSAPSTPASNNGYTSQEYNATPSPHFQANPRIQPVPPSTAASVSPGYPSQPWEPARQVLSAHSSLGPPGPHIHSVPPGLPAARPRPRPRPTVVYAPETQTQLYHAPPGYSSRSVSIDRSGSQASHVSGTQYQNPAPPPWTNRGTAPGDAISVHSQNSDRHTREETYVHSQDSTHREPIYVSSQASVPPRGERSLSVPRSPPPAPPVAPVAPAAKPRAKRKSKAAGEPTGPSPSKSRASKGKGKEKAPDPPVSEGEGDVDSATPRPAKCQRAETKRTEKTLTDQDIQAASINPVPAPAKQTARKNSPWTKENILAFVSAWYAVDSYDFYKENQSQGYRDISEKVFHGAITEQQMRDFNARLTEKYKIYNNVAKQTGGGRPDADLIDARMNDGSYRISTKSIMEYGNSEIYTIMHEVLKKDPSILKDLSLDSMRALSPSVGELSDCEEKSEAEDTHYNSDGDVEVVVDVNGKCLVPKIAPEGSVISINTTDNERATPRPTATKKRGPYKKRTTDEDDFGAQLTESMSFLKDTAGTMSAAQVEQSRYLKTKQAVQQQALLASKLEFDSQRRKEEREDGLFRLGQQREMREGRDSVFRRFQFERTAQLNEKEKIAEWRRTGDPYLMAEAERLQQAHALLPYEKLLLGAVNNLYEPNQLDNPPPNQPPLVQRQDNPPPPPNPAPSLPPTPNASSVPSSGVQTEPGASISAEAGSDPQPSASQPTDSEPTISSMPNEGEAGPGPSTRAIFLGSVGPDDV